MNRHRMHNSTLVYGPPPSAAGTPVRVGQRVTVDAWETALLFRDGALVDRLAPGTRRVWARRCRVRRVDLRPWILAIPTQEIPTADGVTVKLTVSAQCRVTDAERQVTGAQDTYAALYLAVQVALRELVAGLTVDRVDVKDVILPADLKRAQAQVLLARAEGLAALERARGETAALRSLANAARLTADNPALFQLRLLQHLEASTGHTVVLGSTLEPLGGIAGLAPAPKGAAH